MKRKFGLLLVMGSLFFASARAGQAAIHPAPSDHKKVRVIASFSILGDWVQQVGGQDIELKVLVGRNGDAHTYEPTPQAVRALQQAKLIFENGQGFEAWMDKLVLSSETQAKRVRISEGLMLRSLAKSETDQKLFDPHVWYEVQNVIVMVKVIQTNLALIDPAHARSYQTNAEVYIQALQNLDTWIREQVKIVPVTRRKLVTSHDTFGYFARAYGFQILGTALGISTEAEDPSAKALASLLQTIRQEHIPAIFTENVYNNKVVTSLAKEANIRIVTTLYTDALGPEGSPADTYLKLMRYNVTQMVEALK